jgi:type II secretory pathway pseudopilin PulG
VKKNEFIACGLIVALIFCGLLSLRFSRTREFRAQAQVGQLIVQAIDEYRKQTGNYPALLADLAPKYLPIAPDLPDEPNHKFTGWDYRVVTNQTAVSYSLKYYLGRGGIEYEPPNWIGNNEGTRTVILSNK